MGSGAVAQKSTKAKITTGKQHQVIEVTSIPLKVAFEIKDVAKASGIPWWGPFEISFAINKIPVVKYSGFCNSLYELQGLRWETQIYLDSHKSLELVLLLDFDNPATPNLHDSTVKITMSHSPKQNYGVGHHKMDLHGLVVEFDIDKTEMPAGPYAKVTVSPGNLDIGNTNATIKTNGGEQNQVLDGPGAIIINAIPPPKSKTMVQVEGDNFAAAGLIIGAENVSQATLPLIPNQSGQALFGFSGNNFPGLDKLAYYLQNFDFWSVYTLDDLPMGTADLLAAASKMPRPFKFSFSGFPDLDGSAGLGAAGARLWASNAWPYYYRFLSATDPTVAKILAGQDLAVTVKPSKGFQAAASRAEMTYRHLRPGGNVLEIGTDRISTGRNLPLIYEGASTRGTGEVIRVDPRVIAKKGKTFLSQNDLMSDLEEFEAQTQKELTKLKSEGAGKTKIKKLETRLEAIDKSKDYVSKFKEGQGVESIPNEAISPASKMVSSELAAMRLSKGLRFGGGVLMVYGAYSSAKKIYTATPEARPRVATQEAGGWAGGLAGAWAVGSLFAVCGAAAGIETGPGAVLIGAAGGLLGGVIGGIGGAMGADWVYDLIDDKPVEFDPPTGEEIESDNPYDEY